MNAPDKSSELKRKAGEHKYLYGTTPEVTAVLGMRRAETHAAFFTPYLHPGMRLLDCGCGPGSITCDLARIVVPGEAVGIDLDPKAIDAAVTYATQQGVTNVKYQTANVYELPFVENSFDAVFSHALLSHLTEPLKALREMRRVLRPGGLMGACSPDFDGDIIAPPDSPCAEFMRLLRQLHRENGDNACLGKHLRELFHQTGCVDVVATASYECHGTPESLGLIVTSVPSSLGQDGLLVRAGLIDPERGAELAAALETWANGPAAFLARNWCHAVGWVE